MVASEISQDFLARAWRRFRRHRLAMAGACILSLLVFACFIGPLLTAHSPSKTNMDEMLTPPGSQYLLGTDDLGRDLLARLLSGGRISFLVALSSISISLLLGTFVGSLAGYRGGAVDGILSRIIDIFMTFPPILLLILLITLLGPRIPVIILAIGLLRWMAPARIVRASFLSMRESEFVEAARAVGVPEWRIVVRHMLPNALGPLIVTLTLGISDAILLESSLSFLGLGVQPPAATWGNLLRDSQDIMFQAPWTAIFPGLAIFLTIISANHLGDALRDAMDPRHLR